MGLRRNGVADAASSVPLPRSESAAVSGTSSADGAKTARANRAARASRIVGKKRALSLARSVAGAPFTGIGANLSGCCNIATVSAECVKSAAWRSSAQSEPRRRKRPWWRWCGSDDSEIRHRRARPRKGDQRRSRGAPERPPAPLGGRGRQPETIAAFVLRVHRETWRGLWSAFTAGAKARLTGAECGYLSRVDMQDAWLRGWNAVDEHLAAGKPAPILPSPPGPRRKYTRRPYGSLQ